MTQLTSLLSRVQSPLLLWLKANDSSTIVENGSIPGNVEKFVDKANGFIFSQTNSTSQLTLGTDIPSGEQVLEADGADDFMECLDPALFKALQETLEFTLFVVFKVNNVAHIGTIFSASDEDSSSAEYALRLNSAAIGASCRNASSAWQYSGANGTFEAAHSSAVTSMSLLDISASFNQRVTTARSFLNLNGSQILATSIRATFADISQINGVRIGANKDSGGLQWFLDGSFAELKLFNKVLSDTEIAAERVYFQNEWGTP